MGALTGNAVKDTYLDLVQLGKSGAGLPAHAGKEAALYDGSGAQILGRTAVRHWLDPHPDAASFDETWEFSTKGTMTQGQLETAGWTFENCTAAVTGGVLILTADGNGFVRASLSVSFSGDFDVWVTPAMPLSYQSTANPHNTASGYVSGLGVADYRPGTADLAHYVSLLRPNGTILTDSFFSNGAWTTLGGSADTDNIYSASVVMRSWRDDGTLYCCSAQLGDPPMMVLWENPIVPYQEGWTRKTGISDSSTYNKLFFILENGTTGAGARTAIASIRRFQ